MAEAMSVAAGLPEPFTIPRAARPGPLVFASPHSGRVYPPDMGADPAVPEASIRSAEDAFVDRLIATGPDHGATVIAARLGRAYVDLNRDAGELDPALIDGAPEDGGVRAAAGYGVLARLTGDGRSLYARRVPLAEARTRIARTHAPYHAALAELMEATRARHGRAVLVDWHSMPSRAAGGPGRAVRPLDVVIGDRHGGACSVRLTRTLRGLFEEAGWRVGLNQPYAGGYTTRTWGRPDEGFHAVQVELNRALYLDEGSGAPGPGFDRVRGVVGRVIAGLAACDWTAAGDHR
jgi:N-formylglutamate amidohydrolase